MSTDVLVVQNCQPLRALNHEQGHYCSAGIEDLKEKREQILKQIQDEEGEKQKIQQDLAALTQRLSRINESLARKVCDTDHVAGLQDASYALCPAWQPGMTLSVQPKWKESIVNHISNHKLFFPPCICVTCR